MTQDELRTALKELNGQRDLALYFDRAEPCIVPRAMLIPDEPDHLVKVSDGRHVYILDAHRVAWIRIG